MSKCVYLFWCFGLSTLDKMHLTEDDFCLLCKNSRLASHLNLDKSVGISLRLIYRLLHAFASILTNKCVVVLC